MVERMLWGPGLRSAWRKLEVQLNIRSDPNSYCNFIIVTSVYSIYDIYCIQRIPCMLLYLRVVLPIKEFFVKFFLIQIEGLRREDAVCCTDCEAL